MSNETQTTQPMSPEDLADQSQSRAAAFADGQAESAPYQPYPGPMEGAVFGGTAALDAAVEASNVTEDIPPIGPIPADDLLFSMNETQAVYLYFAHGLSGAQSHDEMIEQLQAKRDAAPAAPAEPATPVMEGYLSGGGIVVTKAFTPQAGVDIVIDHQRRLDCEADYQASQSSNVPAPAAEPTPEREKVWNIHLQAWV